MRPVATECIHGRLRPGRLCPKCQLVGMRLEHARAELLICLHGRILDLVLNDIAPWAEPPNHPWRPSAEVEDALNRV